MSNFNRLRQGSYDLSPFKTMELFLGHASVLLPGGMEDSELTSDYSLHWALLFVYVPLCKSMFLPPVACPCDWTLYLGDSPNLRCINYLLLWMKLALAWDFSLPHLSAPFSQVALPPESKGQYQRWAGCLASGYRHSTISLTWGGTTTANRAPEHKAGCFMLS